MKKAILIIIAAMLFIGNCTPLSYVLHENYSYSNYDGSFRDSEEAMGTGAFKTVKLDFRDFLQKYPHKARADTALYRNFTIKPWRFWQWSDFIYCPERFKLPYRPMP